jgi:hypothetical protein
MLAIATAHLTLLISQYQWLVKDRMTLNAEVMHEYDQGFVYKKLFATRMDKSVQTNEGGLSLSYCGQVLILSQRRCCSRRQDSRLLTA